MDAEKFQTLIHFVLPEGRAALAELISEFKAAYGANWIKEFNEQNPDFSFLVDIVANNDAPDAFQKLKDYAVKVINETNLSFIEKALARMTAKGLLDGNHSNILETHRTLRTEIDKPRF